MAEVCAESLDRIELNERWKVDSDETKLAKSLASLRARLVAWRSGASAEMNPALAASAPSHPDAPVDALVERLHATVVRLWQPAAS